MRAHRRLTIAVTLAPLLLAVAAVQCSSESVAPGIDASTLDAAVIEAAPDAAADAPLDERSDSFSPYDGGQAYVPPLYGRCDGHAWQRADRRRRLRDGRGLRVRSDARMHQPNEASTTVWSWNGTTWTKMTDGLGAALEGVGVAMAELLGASADDLWMIYARPVSGC